MKLNFRLSHRKISLCVFSLCAKWVKSCLTQCILAQHEKNLISFLSILDRMQWAKKPSHATVPLRMDRGKSDRGAYLRRWQQTRQTADPEYRRRGANPHGWVPTEAEYRQRLSTDRGWVPTEAEYRQRQSTDRGWVPTEAENWQWMSTDRCWVPTEAEYRQRLSTDRGWVPTEAEYWQRLSSYRGWVPTEAEFRQRLSSDRCWLPTEAEYWQRLSTDRGWVLTEAQFLQRLSSDRGWVPTEAEFWQRLSTGRGWVPTEAEGGRGEVRGLPGPTEDEDTGRGNGWGSKWINVNKEGFDNGMGRKEGGGKWSKRRKENNR